MLILYKFYIILGNYIREEIIIKTDIYPFLVRTYQFTILSTYSLSPSFSA